LEKNAEIGQRIYEIRKVLGLTQQQFAEDLKISQSNVAYLEQNTRKIQERFIKLVCLTYGVNEKWLKTGGGPMFVQGDDYRLEEVIRNFRKLDSLLQDYVLKQIRLALEYQEAKQSTDYHGKR